MNESDSWSDGDAGLPSLADTSMLRPRPVTARGLRTRAALVSAARRVFERDGYLEARLADMTAEADCSTGTFYTYFTNKEEIFHAVLEAAEDDMLHPGFPRLPDDKPVAAVIWASNRAYLESYKRNAKLMAILEQVATINPTFREVRRKRSRAFVQRNARAIVALQEAGLADKGVDAKVAAMALSSMVSRMAYLVFCLEEEISITEVTDTCTRLWVNALQLTPEGSP